MTRRVLLSLFAAALGTWAATPGAMAQQDLPQAVIEATSIAPDQTAQIAQYIADGIRRMTNPDADPATKPADYAAEIKRGRDSLLAPVGTRTHRPSVAFRQEYGKQIAPELDRVVKGGGDLKGDKDVLAINALRIAGEVATPETAKVLEDALNDPRIAVRYAAANAMGRTFEAMTQSNPAIFPERAQDMVAKLGDLVSKDQSPDVLDAAIRGGLAAGTRMDRPNHAAVREAALVVLATQGSARLKALDAEAQSDQIAGAMLRALAVTRLAVAGNAQFSPAAYKKAAELAGNGITYVSRNAREFFTRPPSGRETQRAILNEAEALAQAAAGKAGGSFQSTNLAADFAQGAAYEREFGSKFLQVMKAFQGPPFNFDIGTFVVSDGPASNNGH